MDDYACMFCDGHHGPERGLVNCVRILADRVKKLESKLGAAPVIGSKAQASEATARRQEAGVAPSVSSRGRIRWGTEHQQDDILRADDLAAAVTEWYGTRQVDNVGLFLLIEAFVRGEPLPQRGG